MDGGDTLHGTYPVVKSRGEAMIPILNEMGLEAMTAHWEFAYGPSHLKKLTQKLNYPLLAVNCYQEKNDKLVYPPYTTLAKGNLLIGVIGVAATIVDKVMPSHFSQGIYFTLGNEELPYYIDKLKAEGVDLIIVLSHLGFPQEVKLAEEVPGIDVILSSHTHNRLKKPFLVNKTIIIQSGCHGSFLGRLDLDVQNKRIKKYQHQLITVTPDIDPDETVEELTKKVTEPHQDLLKEKVGITRTPLNRNTLLESTMDNLLLKSLLSSCEAELAFSNGWRYGAPVPPGTITMEDLWNIIPVNPPLTMVELTGREIWQILEENAELTFSRDPYKQMGGYLKRVLGLNLYLKIENPPGQRVQEVFIGGKHINPKRSYSAVYVTSQGVPLHYGTNRKDRDINAIDALKDYIQKEKVVESPLTGAVVAV